MTPGLRRGMTLVAGVGTVAAIAGIGVRARFGGHVAVDEPQYLLTALSIFEDVSLDISDELAARRWVPWAGLGDIPVQTEVLAGGRQISPHDPLLPLLLALPMGLGGWIAAKVTMALLAGALAAVTLWTAVRRFGVPLRLATTGVLLAAASAPLAVYGQQVYPELPAALLVVIAVALLTAPGGNPGHRDAAEGSFTVTGAGKGSAASARWVVAVGAVVTALPWLSVKYVPVAVALTGLAVWRLRGEGRLLAVLAGGLTLMGVAYLAIHRAVWGGWTVYASGDHFQESGEFGVMGFNPNFVGRGLRLAGLLVDRGYGLVAWQPGWLLLVPAAAALAATWYLRKPRNPRRAWDASVLLLPLAAGWLTATFIALTMHGHWWPGRQTVVVLPLALLAVLVWVHRTGRAWPRRTGLVLGVAGVITYGWLIVDGLAVRITWVSGFEATGSPVYRLLRPLLPDYRAGWDSFWPLHLAWVAALLLLITHAWRAGRKDDTDEEGGFDRRRAVHRVGLGADRVQ